MIVVFGGSGFLGAEVVSYLAQEGLKLPGSNPTRQVPRIVIADMSPPPAALLQLAGVEFRQIDATNAEQVASVIDGDTEAVIHLAAVVSGTAEANFDLGMAVNLFGAVAILEACRRQERFLPFLTTSSLAVFGPNVGQVKTPVTPLHPRSSYGTQKAITELLCADFRRKGFVDARVLRLPTITVRPGAPNGAASSFVSGIIREPAHGQQSNCPVNPDLKLWVASPEFTVRNIIHAMSVPADQWPEYAVLDAPGLTTTPREMVKALAKLTSVETALLVGWQKDETINRIVSSWPDTFDTTEAIRLGLVGDIDITYLIRKFLESTPLSA
jgi:nucleoside-diphosphate-sugar epimerase